MSAGRGEATTACPVCGQTFTGTVGDLYQCNGGGSHFTAHAFFRIGDGRLVTP